MRNTLSTEAMADWCDKQPANKWYDYCRADVCALTQYAASLGMETPYAGGFNCLVVTSEFWRAANRAAIRGKHTFGKLAERLRQS